MTPVFGHGRLRLYLLKLLDESPRHGYEVIRLLEERFQGRYAPSAGTVYPRLAKLEKEGLVTHSTEGGRKVYRLTDAGREELSSRQSDLAELELEISDSVSHLAGAIREDVRDSAKDLREELWGAARTAPRPKAEPGSESPWAGAWGDKESWQRAKQEFDRFKQQAKEQAKRAKEQERAAKEQAKAAEAEAKRVREQSKEEALRLKRRVEEQVREHTARGDWSTGLAEGLAELTRGLGALADPAKWGTPTDIPPWARTDPSGDPARELERLLDRFRDQVRDAARDRGVTADQLAEAQSILAQAAEKLLRRE